MKNLIKNIVIINILLLLIGFASATDYTVCSSGCDYTTIQAAENAASNGDTILVQSGTYNEGIVVDTQNITIQGAGMDVVKVISSGHVFSVQENYITLTGMNISGAGSGFAGIHLDGNFDVCNFSYNKICNCYDGIVVRGGGNDHNLVLNNTVRDCSDVGLMIRDTSYTNVTQNNLFYLDYPIYMRDTGAATFVYTNWVKHCTRAIWQLGTATDLTFYNNYLYNNTINGFGGTTTTYWNISKRSGTNIFGGNYLGGNYWDNYTGVDNNADGLGNTLLPYTDNSQITNGGDYLPLATVNGTGDARNCACGDICVNENNWWRDDMGVNASSTPISSGIAEAESGETVYIFNGSYTDNIVESDTSHVTVIGEGRNVVHVTPTVTSSSLFYIHTDANHFNISGVHGSGGISGCMGIYFLHVTHGNVTSCNFSNCGSHGIAGEHGNYMNIINNIVCNNTLRGITFPYYGNHSYFADNTIMDNGGRGLDLCTHGDDSVFKNNTILRNGILMTGTHYSGVNTHWSNNILYDECRSFGNYGFRDHLIRNDANNITIRNPANPIGESFDFDIEDINCDWRITNTDGQIFTEDSGATAYAHPSNFSMNRANAAETFTIALTPMNLLTTNDKVTVTGVDYNNVQYTEKYNITADCVDTGENVVYSALVANASGEYDCYIDGSFDHTETASAGVVTWSYTGGFATSKTLSILASSTSVGSARNCACGDICVGQNMWWRDDCVVNSSSNPIQTAIYNVNSGETIYVYNGTYNEIAVVDVPHVTLKGEGPDVVDWWASTSHPCNIDESYINITGFNISKAGSALACIHLDGNYDYCNISYNKICNAYDGIVIRGAGNDHNLVLNNTIRDCSDIGIMIRDTSYTNVTQNNLFYLDYPIYIRDTGVDTFVYTNWVKHCTRAIWQLGTATDLTIYNNYLYNNTVNGYGGTATTYWNISKRSGTNIYGGNYLGGNYWDDYTGVDNDADGLGNTLLPYTDGSQITNGGDYLPLTDVAGAGNVRNCAYGDICVNENSWWRDDKAVNASGTPISSGIAEAESGEVVYIFNGSYCDNIVESDTSHVSVIGEGRNIVHVSPAVTSSSIFYIHTDANHFNISGVHSSGGISGCMGIYFLHVTHGNVTDCNFSNCGTHGIAGEHGNYMNVVNNIVCNNTLRGITFPYYANHSYFADNTIMDNGGRGMDLCTHGDDSVFKNNTILRNGLPASGTHYSGVNTHWSNNILYDECRSFGNYGFRDHLIRNDANNITIRNPANPIGESFDFDIEDSNCDWRITNTDGQIFTENSGATAYAHPSNFSMNRANVIETFTIALTPMNLLTTNDKVTVTGIDYNNVQYTEKYNITADCTDINENVVYSALVVNNSGSYDCYIDGDFDHTETAISGVVTWSYTDGFATSRILSIIPQSGGAGPSPGTRNCACGDICVNTTHWWHDDQAPTASSNPIQAGIGGTSFADTVYVFNGSYDDIVVITDSHITLKGEGSDVTHIRNTGGDVVFIANSYINISGFNVSGSPSGYSGIDLNGNYDYCNISYNKVMDCYDGIVVRGTGNDHNLILNNTVRDCSDVGIMVRDTSYTNVTQNNLFYLDYPLYVRDIVAETFVFTNWVKHCGIGIYQLGTATDLIIYNNYFYDNIDNAIGGTPETYWGVAKKSGTNIYGGNYLAGNYWDNYLGVDNTGDGIGDTLLPYTDNGNILNGGDYYPLAGDGVTPTPTPGNITLTNYTPIFNDLFSDLSVWSFITVIFGTYETFCGANLFWLIIIVIPFMMTWIKQGSVIVPSMIALLCGSSLFVLLPVEAVTPIKYLLIIGIAGIFYHIIKSR